MDSWDNLTLDEIKEAYKEVVTPNDIGGRVFGFYSSKGFDIAPVGANHVEFIGYDSVEDKIVRGYASELGISFGRSPIDVDQGAFVFTGPPENMGGTSYTFSASILANGDQNINAAGDRFIALGIQSDVEISFNVVNTYEVYVNGNKYMMEKMYLLEIFQ